MMDNADQDFTRGITTTDHTDYPLPPDPAPEPGTEGIPISEPVPDPAPSHSAIIPSMALPRARRQIKTQIEAVKAAMKALKSLELGETVELDALSLDALVCGATDTRFPLGDTHPHADRYRQLARQGRFNDRIEWAMDELEDVFATLEAALAALKAVSLLDEPLPGEWGNLHPVLLARKLNSLGHTLLRGRIAGVSL